MARVTGDCCELLSMIRVRRASLAGSADPLSLPMDVSAFACHGPAVAKGNIASDAQARIGKRRGAWAHRLNARLKTKGDHRTATGIGLDSDSPAERRWWRRRVVAAAATHEGHCQKSDHPHERGPRYRRSRAATIVIQSAVVRTCRSSPSLRATPPGHQGVWPLVLGVRLANAPPTTIGWPGALGVRPYRAALWVRGVVVLGAEPRRSKAGAGASGAKWHGRAGKNARQRSVAIGDLRGIRVSTVAALGAPHADRQGQHRRNHLASHALKRSPSSQTRA